MDISDYDQTAMHGAVPGFPGGHDILLFPVFTVQESPCLRNSISGLDKLLLYKRFRPDSNRTKRCDKYTDVGAPMSPDRMVIPQSVIAGRSAVRCQ